MQRRKADTTASSNVPAWAILAAILVLVVILGGLAYKNFGPSGPTPVKTATSDWLEKLARESGGDINKLSPADQAKVNQIPFGGAQWLKRKYESLR